MLLLFSTYFKDSNNNPFIYMECIWQYFSSFVRPRRFNQDFSPKLSVVDIATILQNDYLHFYTPDLSGRIMVWRGRLSVCGSVHKACKHNTD